MAKKDNKKGDDVIKFEMKKALDAEIKSLESQIFLEQQKTFYNNSQLEKHTLEIEVENNDINKLFNEESKKVNIDGDNLKNVISGFSKEVEIYENQINEYEDEIKRLENEIYIIEVQNKRELDEKDSQIAEQRKTFEDLSVRFQHILQRTANKLQERVDMGR